MNKLSVKSFVIASVSLLCVAVVLLYVLFYRSNSKPGFPGAKGPRQTGPVSVRTQTAVPVTLHDYVITNGEIEAKSSVDVFPDRGGKVVSVEVSLGSYVKRGQVIAKIDPSVPGAQYEQSPVFAPISGTITASPLRIGTTVSASSVITTIGDVENLQITANVPERYVSDLKPGLMADIVLESYPGEIFKAYVTRVSPVVDKKSRTKEVIMSFTEKDPRVNAGMFAKVTLWTSDYEGKPAFPASAFIEKSGSTYLYKVDSEKETADRRKVVTGKSVDNMVQVLEGIAEGERVVVEGMRILSDGASVKDISLGAKNTAGEE